MLRKFSFLKDKFSAHELDYDYIYSCAEGWLAYAMIGTTCSLRSRFAAYFERLFPGRIADVETKRHIRLYDLMIFQEAVSKSKKQ